MVGGAKEDGGKPRGKHEKDPGDEPQGSLRARRSQEAKQKREGDEGEPEQKKGLVARYGGTVAFVVVLLLVGFVALADGGPDADREGAMANSKVTDWSVVAALPDGSEEVLCAEGDTCTLQELWPAVVAGAECRFEASVWLATSNNPVFLRGLQVERINVTTMGGDPDYNGTQQHNFTIQHDEQQIDQGEGAWLRAFSKHVDLAAPVACDTMSVTSVFMLSGKSLFGSPWSSQVSVTQLIHQDVSGLGFDAEAMTQRET